MKTIHGNPTAAAFDQIGVTGLKAFSGYVLEEYLPELMGQKALKAYKTMGDDPIVTALLTAITLILRAVDWRVEPADDGSDHRNAHSAKAEQEAEFAQGLLDDMSHPWEDVINETLSMLQYGWAYLEIVLKTRLGPDQDDPAKRSKFNDGRIGIRKLPIRAQESLLRWQLQEDGGVEGMWQQPPQGGQQLFIPIERALLFRTTSKKNSPEGVSILRAAYRPWFIKRGVEDHEAIGIERELAGLPVVSIPKRYLEPGASGEDLAFANTARMLARDIKLNSQAGVVIPSEPFKNPDGTFSSVPMVKLELLSSGGSGKRAIDTDIVVKRYNRLIAMSAMADFITLGDERGSYSLSQNKSELFLRSCESYLNQIAAVVNRFLFPRIFAYNGIDPALIPVLKPGRLAPVDLNELGTYVAQLAAAGAPLFPNQELSNYLADVAGLPEPPEDIGLQPPPGKLPRFGQINPDTGEPMTLDEHAQYQQADLGGTTFGENASVRANTMAKYKKYNENHDELGRFAESGALARAPGTAPIPAGHVRLYHQTSIENAAKIAQSGVKFSEARGIEGPKAIYADEKGFYGDPKTYSGATVEFHVPAEQWKQPFVMEDVAPENITAIHLPWHRHARYIENNPKVLQQVLAGEHDRLLNNPEHGPAISYIQRTHAAKRRLAKYNENHDELGRFAEGPGTGGQAKALYDKTLEHGVTPEHIYDRVGHGAQDAAKKIEATMATRVPSDAPVEQGGFKNADGTYTADRQALHDKLLADTFTPEKIDAATPGLGEKPTMTMLGGRGGSGKSFLTGPDGPVEKGTMVLNSDDFKGPLAEASGLDHRYAALYHEESDHVLKMASQRAKDLGLNVAFDSTMKSEATAAGRMQEYKDAGYDVNGHYVHTAPQFAAERSVHRFYRGGSANGRFVPPHVILGNTKNEANFDKLSPNFQSWTLWDNNGTKPVLVARGGK
jgi:predicted ABC-type ATPase